MAVEGTGSGKDLRIGRGQLLFRVRTSLQRGRCIPSLDDQGNPKTGKVPIGSGSDSWLARENMRNGQALPDRSFDRLLRFLPISRMASGSPLTPSRGGLAFGRSRVAGTGSHVVGHVVKEKRGQTTPHPLIKFG